MRKTDLIARLGGDEFAVLMEDFADERDPIRTAERIHQAISQPFYLDENEVFTTTSVGIATGQSDYKEAEDIVRDADTAMYRAKSNGKAQHVLFDVELHQEAMERLQVENDLRRAVESDEFLLVYQPIISVESRRTVGFEALIRWKHPEKGMVSPVVFIPVAEETGLISPMGWWILDTACRQLKDWQDRDCVEPDVTVAVNISGKQFLQVDFVEQLMAIVAKTGLPPRSLKLEVTESVIAQNPDKVKLILEEIRTSGIQLCIDDFGTGYSSFSYLHRFPFDVLKIDRSFIGNIDTDNEAWEISQALVAMSHKLDLKVVAEGVEKPEQLLRLGEMGCDLAQGYLMAKPMMVDEVEKFMRHEPEVWEKQAAMVS
jgi:EAL domain-containing protein (putative c-di-GMP-specific phosphodiesterase class I)